MSQEEQEQKKNLNSKFFWGTIFYWTRIFFGPKIFRNKIFLDPKYFQAEIFFLTQNNFWAHFFSDPKRCLEGENKAFEV